MSGSTTRSKYAVQPKYQPLGSSENEFLSLLNKGKTFFSGEYASSWENACNKLVHAGYGALIPLSYARYSPQIANKLQQDVAIHLASLVSLAAIKVNRAAAELISKSALIAAEHYNSASNFLKASS